MAKKLVLPRVHALILCDAIRRDPDDEEVVTLVNVRTQIFADAFPYTHPRLCVYLQVTGHEGTAAGTVTLIQARTDQALLRYHLPTTSFKGPLALIPLSVRMRRCVFPEAGIYYIQVHFEEKLLGERFLELIQL
jgi:hypothetical protein